MKEKEKKKREKEKGKEKEEKVIEKREKHHFTRASESILWTENNKREKSAEFICIFNQNFNKKKERKSS